LKVNYAVSSAALKREMSIELVGCGSGCGILKYYYDTSLEGLRKTKNFTGRIIKLLPEI
jgi:hypothetical protein